MADSFVADGEVHDDIATGHRPWFGTTRAGRRTPDRPRRRPRRAGWSPARTTSARYLLMMMNGEDDLLSAAGQGAR